MSPPSKIPSCLLSYFPTFCDVLTEGQTLCALEWGSKLIFYLLLKKGMQVNKIT